jgi:hypothetical protein
VTTKEQGLKINKNLFFLWPIQKIIDIERIRRLFMNIQKKQKEKKRTKTDTGKLIKKIKVME